MLHTLECYWKPIQPKLHLASVLWIFMVHVQGDPLLVVNEVISFTNPISWICSPQANPFYQGFFLRVP